MSKTVVTVFLCTGKDCSKAWRRACNSPPGKWLKRQVEAAGLPYKLAVVKTACMDRCDEAACVCFVASGRSALLTEVPFTHNADELLAALRSCVESGQGRSEVHSHELPLGQHAVEVQKNVGHHRPGCQLSGVHVRG